MASHTDLTLRARLNGPWHRPALRIFSAIVLAHLAEHIVQAWQVYVLGYPLMEARGILGQWFPWLVHSEVMHFGYALIMLAGLWLFLPGFVGRARKWWLAALVIEWDDGPHAKLGTKDILDELEQATLKPGAVAQNIGNVDQAMAGGGETYEL